MDIFLIGPLSTKNKMADERNVLAGDLILLLLVLPAADFQYLGKLFCTLLVISLSRLYLGLLQTVQLNIFSKFISVACNLNYRLFWTRSFDLCYI